MYTTSNQKGDIGQKFFELLMTKMNIPCFKPINTYFYDYIILLDSRFIRIEVKTSNTDRDGAVTFCTNHSDGRRNTMPYNKADVDCIFVYSLNGYYAFLPPEVWSGRKNLSLRYKGSKNNINYLMFSDFSFEKYRNYVN